MERCLACASGFNANIRTLPYTYRRSSVTLVEFIVLLVIAAICGSLAQAMAGYSHGGCLVSAALGLIGALLGTWLAHLFDLPDILAIQIGGRTFPIVWSIIGAALFVAILSVVSRPRYGPPGGP
jgi:uncharacterized membrane protein YeaQ/YmgE (transglycosylase-associated protein family)